MKLKIKSSYYRGINNLTTEQLDYLAKTVGMFHEIVYRIDREGDKFSVWEQKYILWTGSFYQFDTLSDAQGEVRSRRALRK